MAAQKADLMVGWSVVQLAAYLVALKVALTVVELEHKLVDDSAGNSVETLVVQMVANSVVMMAANLVVYLVAKMVADSDHS